MVCLRNICTNTLHKGDNDDDNNNTTPHPGWYRHLDEGVSRGGLESLNDARGYAGGSLASGRVTLTRQALAKRPD